MGAIYRRYHEKYRKLRAERAQERAAYSEKFEQAARDEKAQQDALAEQNAEEARDTDPIPALSTQHDPVTGSDAAKVSTTKAPPKRTK